MKKKMKKSTTNSNSINSNKTYISEATTAIMIATTSPTMTVTSTTATVTREAATTIKATATARRRQRRKSVYINTGIDTSSMTQKQLKYFHMKKLVNKQSKQHPTNLNESMKIEVRRAFCKWELGGMQIMDVCSTFVKLKPQKKPIWM